MHPDVLVALVRERRALCLVVGSHCLGAFMNLPHGDDLVTRGTLESRQALIPVVLHFRGEVRFQHLESATRLRIHFHILLTVIQYSATPAPGCPTCRERGYSSSTSVSPTCWATISSSQKGKRTQRLSAYSLLWSL